MNIISSGIDSNSKLLEYRFKLLNTILIVAAVFAFQIMLVGAFILETIDNNTISLSIYGALNLFLYFYLRFKQQHFYIVVILFLIFSTMQFTSAAILVPDDQMRWSWYFLVVLTSFLLAGRIIGIIFTLVIITLIVYMQTTIDTGYSLVAVITTINSVVIFALISYFYVKKVENDQTQLNQLNQDLELQVHEEVAKNLQQAQEFEQQREKDMKFTTIGQISAGITHEINTPLTYIKGNMEILLDNLQNLSNEKIKKSLIEDIENMSSGVQRISNIIDSMKNISTKQENKYSKFNLYNALINSLRLTYNRSKIISKVKINSKLFLLSTKKDNLEYIVNGSQQEIEQVFIILINNALDELVKIPNFENRAININLYNHQNSIKIEFLDNAQGVDENIIDNIFDPLVSNKYEKGMGMGLNIAKKILDKHNAKISVESNQNGTKFIIEFIK